MSKYKFEKKPTVAERLNIEQPKQASMKELLDMLNEFEAKVGRKLEKHEFAMYAMKYLDKAIYLDSRKFMTAFARDWVNELASKFKFDYETHKNNPIKFEDAVENKFRDWSSGEVIRNKIKTINHIIYQYFHQFDYRNIDKDIKVRVVLELYTLIEKLEQFHELKYNKEGETRAIYKHPYKLIDKEYN